MTDTLKNDDNKPVAVIVLNWNGEKLLKEFLPSVVELTPSDIADVIVADNNSTDNSVELVEKNFPSVKLLRFSENYGYAGGYNRAIGETGYKYTLLLNSDVAVIDGWLYPLYEFMESMSDAGACQPKILSYTEPHKFEYAGAAGGFLDRFGYPYCRGRIMNRIETDRGQYDDTRKVFWASGAALMVRTSVYEEAGGLDESFFAHQEEIDLCWRMQLLGFGVYAVGSSAVYHLGGGSLHVSDPKKTYLNFRNNLLMMHKNLPPESRRNRLFVRRLIDTLAFLKFALTFDLKNARAVVKAHQDFSAMAKSIEPNGDLTIPDLLRSYPNSGESIFFMRGGDR